MKPKLILVEGIPGFGKTTTAQLVHEILTDKNIKTQLYLEGNLDHPADYDGVACFKKEEYDELLNNHEKFRDVLNHRIINEGNHYFLEYRKMINENTTQIPSELLDGISRKDVYELTLDHNKELITKSWKQFTKRALNGSDTYIFDCCFMQNPITIGMIKYGATNEDVTRYIKELEKIIEELNPLLIYVEQNDPEHSFRKAIKERPKEWSEGFIEYYTNQGYGKKFGYIGLEGTLQVLKARRELEEEIFNNINIAKEKANNSSYNLNVYKQVIVKILTEHFGLT